MTLKEIAALANVSPSTVSRVLRKDGEKYASKEVRDRIWKIVQETQYSPNVNAQKLKMNSKEETEQKKYKIACIYGRGKEFFDDQFFYEIFKGIEQEIYKNGGVICSSFALSPHNQTMTFEALKNENVDGVIVLGRCGREIQNQLVKKLKNIVFVSLNPSDVEADQIFCDGKRSAETVVEFLYQQNHKKIAYIGELDNEQRYLGYCNKMKELKLPLKREWIQKTELTISSAYENAKQMLENDSSMSAIFCCNDNVAIGTFKAVTERKLKIPEDISIIGIDDTEMSQFTTPMLTSIRIPKNEMGVVAAQTLLNRIEKRHKLPMKIELPFRLTIRDSCCRYCDRKEA